VNRVVVVGFDAMDVTLARQLVQDGRLPTFGRLFETAGWAPTRNPEGLVVGGIWPSFATGQWPGGHGFYCFRQFENRSYEIRRFSPYDISPPALWESLSARGKRCCVVDAPLTRPATDLAGTHVVDWGTHDRMLAPGAWPTSAADLLTSHGPHPVDGKCDDYAARGDLAGLRDALVGGAARKTDLNLALLDQEPWDLFLTVYSESHCAGHQFWSLHDRSWPGHDPERRAELGDPLEATYEALDGELARLLDAVDPSDALVVLLSHGIGAHHDGDHLFGEIVRRLDAASGRASIARRAGERALRGVRRYQRDLARRRRPDDPALVGRVSVDGARRFFSVPNNELFAAIRLNLVGREPRGRIRPGTDQLRWCDWLEERLLELRGLDGRPIVRRVLRVDDLFPGPRRAHLPDLLVDWHRDRPIEGATSPVIGEVHGTYGGIRSGDHRPGGLVLVRDRGVAPGPRPRIIDVVDLAPTISARLGEDLPGVDGSPATDLLPADIGAPLSSS
jgi:predicted AlkP superfamily phosphohydrolase/phosphomutase